MRRHRGSRARRGLVVAATSLAVLVPMAGVNAKAPVDATHDAAVAEAETMLAAVPTIPAETSVSKAPDSSIKHPLGVPASSSLVIRKQYWTADESSPKVVNQMPTPAGFSPPSEEGDASEGRWGVSWYAYTPTSVPSDIAYAQLVFEVSQRAHRTDIGWFAVALAYPPRPAKEAVPTTGTTATVSYVVGIDATKPLARTASDSQVDALVSAFNAMDVAPDLGPINCPVDFGTTRSVTFRSGEDRWKATAGSCGFVTVTRDGVALPALEASDAFDSALEAALGLSALPRRERLHTIHDLRLIRRDRPADGRERRIVPGNRWNDQFAADIDQMASVPANYYPCVNANGRRTILALRSGGHRWVLNEAPCHAITLKRDGERVDTLVADDWYAQDVAQILRPRRAAPLAARRVDEGSGRPAAEHIPHSVHDATIESRPGPPSGDDQTVTVHGAKARHLVRIFDRLHVVPAGSVRCDIAGGPEKIVTFTGKSHTWVATEAACTDITVTRDGQHLPALLETPVWDNTLAADLSG